MMAKTLLATAISISLLLTLASPSQAVSYAETGDAGKSFGTAQATAVNPAAAFVDLSSISGSLLASSDADIFAIYIPMAIAFSATTINPPNTLDTQLFLFNSNGLAVYGNDDDPSGTSLGSTLPANNAFSPQVAGLYFLAISLAGSDPVDVANQLMFATTSLSTGIRPPNPFVATAVNNFDASLASGMGATYQINLAGAQTAAVPEPGSVVLVIVSLLGLVIAFRHARRQLPV